MADKHITISVSEERFYSTMKALFRFSVGHEYNDSDPRDSYLMDEVEQRFANSIDDSLDEILDALKLLSREMEAHYSADRNVKTMFSYICFGNEYAPSMRELARRGEAV